MRTRRALGAVITLFGAALLVLSGGITNGGLVIGMAVAALGVLVMIAGTND